MVNHRRRSEAALAVAERRRREDEAPRLRAEVPKLATLNLEIDERRGTGALAGSSHIRRVVVDHAPALFVVACSSTGCGGVHDLTNGVLRALRAGTERFEGETPCDGCECVLRHVATATYA